MGTRRIIRLDELSFEMRLERRTSTGSLSGRIMRLVPVFTLETHNYKCLPKFVQTDNASSSIKTAILERRYAFSLDLKREIVVVALCISKFRELKNFGPRNLIANSLIFVRAGNRKKALEFLVL